MTSKPMTIIYSCDSQSSDQLPSVRSYCDLAKELRKKNLLLFSYEEKIIEMDLDKKSIAELSQIEREIALITKQTLFFSKALNQNTWVEFGISEKQHEQACKRTLEIMKEFKALKNEITTERKQKQKARQFNLTETNAAMVFAPFATYGFLNLFFTESPAISKSAAIIVFSSEMIYVFYKRNPDQWSRASKQITTKVLTALSGKGAHKMRRLFSACSKHINRYGRKIYSRTTRKLNKILEKSTPT